MENLFLAIRLDYVIVCLLSLTVAVGVIVFVLNQRPEDDNNHNNLEDGGFDDGFTPILPKGDGPRNTFTPVKDVPLPEVHFFENESTEINMEEEEMEYELVC